MVLNFDCKRCGHNYDFQVGQLTFDANGDGQLELPPHCAHCGSNAWALSEIGQSQVTAVHLEKMTRHVGP